MQAFGQALEAQLKLQVDDLFAAIEGIPDEDLNHWKPQGATEGGQEMSTFMATAIHVASAGEFMTVHAVGGQPSTRVRDGEFSATGSFEEIRERFDRWLAGVHDVLENLTDEDLGRDSHEQRYTDLGWKVARVLLHALDHTAAHVGHLQIQRQLWNVERQ